MKGKQVFIDTNIYIYVAVRHPDFFDKCYRILRMLVDGEFRGYGSKFVLFELFGALSKISPAAAYEASHCYLNLPLKNLDIDREALKLARDIAARSGTTYDAIHAAMMMRNNITTIVTEDLRNWLKIQKVWAEVTKKHKLGPRLLKVFAPSRDL